MYVVVQTGSHLPPIRKNVFCSANCFQAMKNLIFCCASCDFWASVCLAVALSAWKCLLRAGTVRLEVSPKIALGSAPPPCRDQKASKSVFGWYSFGNFLASAEFLVVDCPAPQRSRWEVSPTLPRTKIVQISIRRLFFWQLCGFSLVSDFLSSRGSQRLRWE